MFSVGIEGGIGAGKSSLARFLGERFGWQIQLEPAASEDGEVNPYLQDYLKNPKRWALEMQMYLLARRRDLIKKATRNMWDTGLPFVLDRTAFGDICFAKVNHAVGNIDARGFMTYLDLRNDVLLDGMQVPTFTIFLDCKVDTLIDRCCKRDRAGERDAYDADYFKRLDVELKMLRAEMHHLGSNVVALHWDEDLDYTDVRQADLLASRVLENLMIFPRFSQCWNGLKHKYVPTTESVAPFFDSSILAPHGPL